LNPAEIAEVEIIPLMKKQLGLAITVGLIACASTVANAQLVNGTLDTTAVGPQTLATPVGWNVVVSGGANTSDSLSSETFANVFAPSGFGAFFKSFQGTSNNPVSINLYQNVPGLPGVAYSLTGWAGAEANYSGINPAGIGTQTLLSLVFLGSSSNVLGSVSLDLQANGLGQGAPTSPATGFGYHPFTVNGVSPAGTVTVEASLAMINGYAVPGGGGAAFVGDWFTLVPEPSAIGLGLLGASVLIFRRRK
jgi:hypothetical protein